ncbi:hypothetical protein CBW65_04915 [Tumebacillus avium]|uniref:Uncharacterized protein n=1 Tax=Tumebacillus avium TaxID=1903704 RepID=A0A1Y0IJ50_9BACL|nr:hypothetical protein CBW65_04915 [Tumebacillus avium]
MASIHSAAQVLPRRSLAVVEGVAAVAVQQPSQRAMSPAAVVLELVQLVQEEMLLNTKRLLKPLQLVVVP